MSASTSPAPAKIGALMSLLEEQAPDLVPMYLKFCQDRLAGDTVATLATVQFGVMRHRLHVRRDGEGCLRLALHQASTGGGRVAQGHVTPAELRRMGVALLLAANVADGIAE